LDGASGNGTETATPPKKGMSWLPIIIIAASIVALLLIGLIILFFRKKNNAAKGGKYNQAPTNEQGTQPK
jgi:flagellar basal body-associated protein FliL